MKQVFKRGYGAVKDEEKRRKEEREASKGKLYRVYFPKEADEDPDYEIPVDFLTSEPITYHEHSVMGLGGKRLTRTCTGAGCKDCANGNKPRFVGAYLVIDKRPFERELRDANGNKTGKKEKIKATIKMLVRGQTDLAQLDRLNTKYGLEDFDWAITKTGSDQNTKWSFDRGEENSYSKKEIQAIMPETLRGKDYYDIVVEQITPTESDGDDESIEGDDENVRKRVNSGVQRLDDEGEDEGEDERPSHRRAVRTSSSKKTSSTANRRPIRKK